jgi:plastocyanin
MNKRIVLILLTVSVFLLFLSCAGLQTQVKLDEGKKENTVDIRASNFKFEPNNLLTYEGNTILFRIENVTISEHNFTLTDPEGAVIESVDIPRNKTAEINVTFSRPGMYNFYCDKPLHSTLGMKGQVEVAGK